MQLPKTEIASTHDLRVGDLVFTHGEVFELTSVYAGSAGVSRTDQDFADVVGFRTRLVKSYWQEMPRQWAADWHIQGNALATWSRVVQPTDRDVHDFSAEHGCSLLEAREALRQEVLP